MNATDIQTPIGTYGLAVEAWGQVFAVAANWARASSPVFVLNKNGDGWDIQDNGLQVANYRHRATGALRDLLMDVLSWSGDSQSLDDAESIVADAVRIDDQGGTDAD